jgi:hypothetical protein
MSKEHFWPKWAGQIVSNPQSKSYVSELHTSSGYPATPVHPPLQRKRNGDLSTLKLRVVCRSCNNGWMSRAEQGAKPHLLALIAGTQSKMGPDAQRAVAAWIAMKVIVAEHDQPETALTPLPDREALMREPSMPPDYFVIRIGIHTLATPAGYRRHSQTLVFASHDVRPAPKPDMLGMERNVQTVTFTFAKLLVHVFAARSCGLAPEKMLSFSELALPQLWPPRPEPFTWPPSRVVERREFPMLLNGLEDLVAKQKLKWAPL